MKNNKPYISMALICALTSIAAGTHSYADSSNRAAHRNENKRDAQKLKCDWQPLSATELQRYTKELAFDGTKLKAKFEIPKGSADRFVMEVPYKGEAKSGDISAETSEQEIKDLSTPVGLSISFCSTKDDETFQSFMDEHQSDKRNLLELSKESGIGAKEKAIAGFSTGSSVILSKQESYSPALAKVLLTKKGVCASGNCQGTKPKDNILKLIGIDEKFAKEGIAANAAKEVDGVFDFAKQASDLKSLNEAASKIKETLSFLDTLSLDAKTKADLIAKLQDARLALIDFAKDRSDKGDEDADKYMNALYSMSVDALATGGLDQDVKNDLISYKKDYASNSEFRKKLAEDTKEASLVKTAESRLQQKLAKRDQYCTPEEISGQAKSAICDAAKRNLAEFVKENYAHLPKVQEMVKAQQAQQQLQKQQWQQQPQNGFSPWLQQFMPNQQQTASASAPAVPDGKAHDPFFYANSDIFTKAPNVALVPPNNYGYSVNTVYQNQQAQPQVQPQTQQTSQSQGIPSFYNSIIPNKASNT